MQSLNKTVVFDIIDDQLFGNRVFDYNISKKISHTYEPVAELARRGRELGFNFITPDIFLAHTSDRLGPLRIFLWHFFFWVLH